GTPQMPSPRHSLPALRPSGLRWFPLHRRSNSSGIIRSMRSCTGFSGFCLTVLLAALPAPGQTPPKLQALIITGQNGHDWRAVTPVLRKALEDTGRFEVRVTEEF